MSPAKRRQLEQGRVDYRAQAERANARLVRRAAWPGRDGPLPQRTTEAQAAHKAEARRAHLAAVKAAKQAAA